MPNGHLPQAPQGLRLYAVGDIHGRLDLLQEMDRLIAADARSAKGATGIIMLGDYIDRGPDSAGVIQHLIDAKARDGRVTLRGNHEVYVLELLDDPSVLARWRRYGGVEALASWGIDLSTLSPAEIEVEAPAIAKSFLASLPPAHRRFFEATALSYRAGDYFFAHAGIRPGVPLDAQHDIDLLTIREPFHSSLDDHGVVVVHGHTPGPAPVLRSNRIGIDTKAYDSGRLTCLVLEGTEQRFLVT